MHVVVLGHGVIGSALVALLRRDDRVERITIVDPKHAQALVSSYALDKRICVLSSIQRHNVAASDIILGCAPWSATADVIEMACAEQTPIVCVTRPPTNVSLSHFHDAAERNRTCVVLGCGLEPGLTEILASSLAQTFTTIDDGQTVCGGITQRRPDNALRYQPLFGTTYLPIADKPANAIRKGRIVQVPRFSGVEPSDFEGIGQLEAWHDGMLPTMLQSLEPARVVTYSQKTLRWPGYAAAVATLSDLGLTAETPLNVDGQRVVPKRLVEHAFASRFAGQVTEDVTLLRTRIKGTLTSGETATEICELRFYSALGVNSLAFATAFVCWYVGVELRAIITNSVGLSQPEQIVSADRLPDLLNQAARLGHATVTRRTVRNGSKA
jgi:lysine 6-dehydrogenase